MKKEILNSKNVCLLLGVIFGSLIIICYLFAIPSSILLIIGGIQTFEMTMKKKKCFETQIDFKLKQYEKSFADLKTDYDKIKADVDSLKLRQNVNAAFGMRP